LISTVFYELLQLTDRSSLAVRFSSWPWAWPRGEDVRFFSFWL